MQGPTLIESFISLLTYTGGPRTTLILGTRKISVFRKQCIVGYYIGTSKNRVSEKFLHTLYTIKSVYIKFLEQIKNRVSAKPVLTEGVYNKAYCIWMTPVFSYFLNSEETFACVLFRVVPCKIRLFINAI